MLEDFSAKMGKEQIDNMVDNYGLGMMNPNNRKNK